MALKLERGIHLSGNTRELWMQALKDRYEKDKMSIRDLVKWSGRSYGGVYALLKEAGVKLRKRGYQKGTK